jgi:hypothetical protein
MMAKYIVELRSADEISEPGEVLRNIIESSSNLHPLDTNRASRFALVQCNEASAADFGTRFHNLLEIFLDSDGEVQR